LFYFRLCCSAFSQRNAAQLWRQAARATEAALDRSRAGIPEDDHLCPATRGAIRTIARRLRDLPCDNSLVAMNLHRLARELEALAAGHGTAEMCRCRGCAGAPRILEAVGAEPS
jgi:hypothetical protein